MAGEKGRRPSLTVVQMRVYGVGCGICALGRTVQRIVCIGAAGPRSKTGAGNASVWVTQTLGQKRRRPSRGRLGEWGAHRGD